MLLCFTGSVPAGVELIKEIMIFEVNRRILKQNVSPSVRKLGERSRIKALL